MSRPASDPILLDPEAAQALAAAPVGGLAPAAAEAGAETGFTGLDDFDQTLRRTGRLLLQSGATVTLLRADAAPLSQPGTCQGLPWVALPDGPVRSALADLSPLRSLLPVGTGRMRQQSVAFGDDAGKAQAGLLLLHLAPTTGAALVIATLQRQRGHRKALSGLRAKALACGGTPLQMDSLWQRLFPGLVPYDAKPMLPLRADQTAFEAACDIIAAHIPVARANEAGIIADHDSEFLHDYRIALRKIRSVLSLFRGVFETDQTAALKARFSALMAPTGPVRDLDVHLLERQTYHDLLPDSLHAGLDARFDLLAEERKTAWAQLVQHLRRDDHALEMAALEDLFTSRTALLPGPNAALPARDFARSLIWKRYRRISRIAPDIGPDTEDARMHALRIDCKKLRYLIEFFAPLFPKDKVRSLLLPLKALQDNLGLVHDCAVQQANLQLFLQDAGHRGGSVPVGMAQGVGALTALLHQRQTRERARTVKRLARFNSPKTAQRFRDLFRASRHRRSQSGM